MNSPERKKRDWKKILFHEFAEYLVNFCYLAIVFAVFTWQRRILLAGYDIEYTHYWVAVIEALILAKVIMIGAILRLGRGMEDRPLIFPTLYKTVVFTVFVAVFTLLEHAISGLIKGHGFVGGIAEYFEKGPHDFVAGVLLIFMAFIPFFGVKELGRVLGTERIRDLFFRKRTGQGFVKSDPGGA